MDCADYNQNPSGSSRVILAEDSGIKAYGCAAPDNDRFPKTSIGTLNIEGWIYGTGSTAEARVCRSNWQNSSGACGTPDTENGTITGRHYTLTPSIGTTWTSADFGWTSIRMLTNFGGDEVSVAGIYYQD